MHRCASLPDGAAITGPYRIQLVMTSLCVHHRRACYTVLHQLDYVIHLIKRQEVVEQERTRLPTDGLYPAVQQTTKYNEVRALFPCGYVCKYEYIGMLNCLLTCLGEMGCCASQR